MSVFKQLSRVRAAQARMALARRRVGQPAGALLARGREHPLSAVGIAAGTGFVLGSLNVGPSRVPGMTSLLSGGVAAVMAQGTHWLTELAALGIVARAADTGPATAETPDDPPT
jgi:hypothetical protein